MTTPWYRVASTGGQRSWDAARAEYDRLRTSGLQGALIAGLRTVAQQAERYMVGIIKEGRGFAALAPLTRLTKTGGGGKPLIETATLMNSITSVVDESSMVAKVGVMRGARGKGRMAVWNIAMIHELGTRPYFIEVTRRMYAWMQYMRMTYGERFFTPVRPGCFIMHPGIPARPFLQPTLDWLKAGTFEQILSQKVREILQG